jgi:hypothetical protein
MEYRKISEDDFAERMQAETMNIVMSQQEKNRIIRTLKKRNNPIGRFMEREITIPLKTLLAGCAIVIVLVCAVFIPIFRVSEKDLQENRIIIIHEGGRV